MTQKTTMDEVGVTLVNTVTNQGIFDGIININFATFLFTPSAERQLDNGGKTIDIEPELVMSCRLRMGEQCLRLLHQTTQSLIDLIDRSRTQDQSSLVDTKHNELAKLNS